VGDGVHRDLVVLQQLHEMPADSPHDQAHGHTRPHENVRFLAAGGPCLCADLEVEVLLVEGM